MIEHAIHAAGQIEWDILVATPVVDALEDGLEDVEERDVLDEIHGHANQDADERTDDGDHPTHSANVLARGTGVDVLYVDVHGEHRGKGVERRADGRNQSRGKHSHHKAHHTYGEDIGHHEEVGIVGIGSGREDARLAKRIADDAGDDVDGDIENLEPSAEVGALLFLR